MPVSGQGEARRGVAGQSQIVLVFLSEVDTGLTLRGGSRQRPTNNEDDLERRTVHSKYYCACTTVLCVYMCGCVCMCGVCVCVSVRARVCVFMMVVVVWWFGDGLFQRARLERIIDSYI